MNEGGVTYRNRNEPKAHVSVSDSSHKLETFNSRHSLQAIGQAGKCFFHATQLAFAFSRKLEQQSEPVRGNWVCLRLPPVPSSCPCLRKEGPNASGQFQGKEVPYKTEHFTQLYNIIYIKELSFKILECFMSEEIAKQQAEIKKKKLRNWGQREGQLRALADVPEFNSQN